MIERIIMTVTEVCGIGSDPCQHSSGRKLFVMYIFGVGSWVERDNLNK